MEKKRKSNSDKGREGEKKTRKRKENGWWVRVRGKRKKGMGMEK